MIILEECDKSDAPIKEDNWIQTMIDDGHRLTNTQRIQGKDTMHMDYLSYTRCKKWGCRDMSRFDNYQGFPLVKPKQIHIDKLKEI